MRYYLRWCYDNNPKFVFTHIRVYEFKFLRKKLQNVFISSVGSISTNVLKENQFFFHHQISEQQVRAMSVISQRYKTIESETVIIFVYNENVNPKEIISWTSSNTHYWYMCIIINHCFNFKSVLLIIEFFSPEIRAKYRTSSVIFRLYWIITRTRQFVCVVDPLVLCALYSFSSRVHLDKMFWKFQNN